MQSSVRDLGVRHIITSKIEHHAILHTIEQLEFEYEVECSFVKLDNEGLVNQDHLKELLHNSNERTLVSLMMVNNEVGNILNVNEVAYLVKSFGALFHTDAVQAIGHFSLDLAEIPIDFLAASAHKFHGPKGVGFAFIRKDSGLKPIICGGEQERGFRAGTESIHNIVGLSTSLDIAYNKLNEEHAYVTSLKKQLY